MIAPIIMITKERVQDAMKPIMIPDALLPSCSDKARVGMSPSLFGVAMPPTCPRRVDIIAFLREILSM